MDVDPKYAFLFIPRFTDLVPDLWPKRSLPPHQHYYATAIPHVLVNPPLDSGITLAFDCFPSARRAGGISLDCPHVANLLCAERVVRIVEAVEDLPLLRDAQAAEDCVHAVQHLVEVKSTNMQLRNISVLPRKRMLNGY